MAIKVSPQDFNTNAASTIYQVHRRPPLPPEGAEPPPPTTVFKSVDVGLEIECEVVPGSSDDELIRKGRALRLGSE